MSSVQAQSAITVGLDNQVNSATAGAVGNENTVSGNQAFAIGNNNTVSSTSSFVLGNENTVDANNTFAIGNNVSASQSNSVILGNDSTDREATTINQVSVGDIVYGDFAGSGNETNGVVSVGSENGERQVIYVAAGELSETSTDAVNGSQLYATQVIINNHASSTAELLGGNAVVGSDGKITMSNIGGTGADTIDEALNVIAGGFNFATNDGEVKVSAGQTFTIGGSLSKDAAASSQNIRTQINSDGQAEILFADAPSFNGTVTAQGFNASNNRITNVADAVANSDAVNFGQLKRLETSLHASLNKVADESKAGIAGVAALSFLGQPIRRGTSAISAAVGTHEGETALALGASMLSANGRWLIKGGASFDTQSQVTAGAGVTYSW